MNNTALGTPTLPFPAGGGGLGGGGCRSSHCRDPRVEPGEQRRSAPSPPPQPCTLHIVHQPVGIVLDWPDRAGLLGVAQPNLCLEHLGRTCTPVGRPRRKSGGRLRFERQYRD
jgi:hypothetical protein